MLKFDSVRGGDAYRSTCDLLVASISSRRIRSVTERGTQIVDKEMGQI